MVFAPTMVMISVSTVVMVSAPTVVMISVPVVMMIPAPTRLEKDTEYTFKMDVNRDDVIWIKTYDDSSNTGFTGAVTSSIILVSD